MNIRDFHRYGDRPSSVRWRVDSQGLEIEGEGYQRTPGEPKTIARIWDRFSGPIQDTAWTLALPVELILMVIATESQADLDPKQDRKEPRYKTDGDTPDRVSIGLCHVLISTARGVTGFGVGRNWLTVPRNNIFTAGLVLRDDARVTRLDPVLASAKFNAGSLRPKTDNAFGLFVHGNHLERATKWLGDAVAFIASKGGAERDWRWFLDAHDKIL